MATTPWAHLPNASHIDRLLTHLRPSMLPLWAAARDAARAAARDAARDAARAAARDAALTLVAWDDAARWLDPATPSDALRARVAMAPDTPAGYAAMLLLPYKLVLEQIATP